MIAKKRNIEEHFWVKLLNDRWFWSSWSSCFQMVNFYWSWSKQEIFMTLFHVQKATLGRNFCSCTFMIYLECNFKDFMTAIDFLMVQFLSIEGLVPRTKWPLWDQIILNLHFIIWLLRASSRKKNFSIRSLQNSIYTCASITNSYADSSFASA